MPEKPHEQSDCARAPSSMLRRLKWPVTPEVAGSSPLAPVKIPANGNLLLVLTQMDRRLSSGQALIGARGFRARGLTQRKALQIGILFGQERSQGPTAP